MSPPTLIVEPEALTAGRVRIEGEGYRHLFRARRLGRGEAVRLVDGQGRAAISRVEEVTARDALIVVEGPAPSNEPSLRIEIWSALPRPQRASWLVEKATEVGATAIRWLDCRHAGRRMTDSALDRLSRVARAAVEQSQRSRVPVVSGMHGWGEVLEACRGADQSWVLDCAAPVGSPTPSPGSVVLVVGPEGGFTRSERDALASAGVESLGLGARTLRIETAAVVGTAQLLLAATGTKSA